MFNWDIILKNDLNLTGHQAEPWLFVDDQREGSAVKNLLTASLTALTSLVW